MRYLADENIAAGDSGALHLGMALQTEIGIPFDEHFRVNRTMRRMAHDAAFA